MNVRINIDGASRGNPGSSGIGVVISDGDGHVLKEISEYIGNTTNNVAEYTALLRGLEEAIALGATSVKVLTDSELLARQMVGIYKVKADHLRDLNHMAVGLMKKFRTASITHVRRELNSAADKLASAAAARKTSVRFEQEDPEEEGQGSLF